MGKGPWYNVRLTRKNHEIYTPQFGIICTLEINSFKLELSFALAPTISQKIMITIKIEKDGF